LSAFVALNPPLKGRAQAFVLRPPCFLGRCEVGFHQASERVVGPCVSSLIRREAPLPRYYFHLYNDEVLRDETGESFVDAAAAREAAVRGISELIAEQIAAGRRVDLRHRIEIEDERSEIVCVVTFAQLFDGCEQPATPA